MENRLKANKDKYDAIVVAVAHKQFIQLTGSDYQRISADQAIVIDVKGAVQNPTWRL